MKIPLIALVLAVSLVVLPGASANPTRKAHDVFGVEKGEDGRFFFEHDNAKWIVIDSEEHNMPFYWKEGSEQSTWQDPRLTFSDEMPEWKTAEPRETLEINLGKVQPPRASSSSVMVAAIVPVLAFIGAMIARIWYLQTYHPELLWPTKERKERYRNSNKLKPQKSRGKMSQDGKGGRSANS